MWRPRAVPGPRPHPPADANARLEWPRNVASTLHAVCTAAMGLHALPDYLPGGHYADSWYAGDCMQPGSSASLLAAMFVGYLISETAMELWQYAVHGRRIDTATVVHHLLFIGVALVNVHYARFCGPFHALIVGETSTVGGGRRRRLRRPLMRRRRRYSSTSAGSSGWRAAAAGGCRSSTTSCSS